MTIAERIKARRESLFMSQSELARRASCTPACISLIEKGNRTPTIQVLESIGWALSVDYLELAGQKEMPQMIARDLLQWEDVLKLSKEDKKLVLTLVKRLITGNKEV